MVGLPDSGILEERSASYSELLSRVAKLPLSDLQQLGNEVVNAVNFKKQSTNLAELHQFFQQKVDPAFLGAQPELLKVFDSMVQNMRLMVSESAFESTSSAIGTINLELPGLPEGVTVNRLKDAFLVEEGTKLIQRNEIRIKLGGLDAYSGYWLAVDNPITHQDAIQEEGVDTLRRVMEAVGIPITGDTMADALEYPFLLALTAPFGRESIQPFETYLKRVHQHYPQHSGGSWFNVHQQQYEQIADGDGLGVVNGNLEITYMPRGSLSAAEEADLELSKLDL